MNALVGLNPPEPTGAFISGSYISRIELFFSEKVKKNYHSNFHQEDFAVSLQEVYQ